LVIRPKTEIYEVLLWFGFENENLNFRNPYAKVVIQWERWSWIADLKWYPGCDKIIDGRYME